MKDSVLRKGSEVERIVDTGDHPDFRGLRFRVINNLPAGEYVEFVTNEPTYIEQSTGAIKVTAKAPTVIEGGSEKITIDGYAPMWVKGSTVGIEAHLRENTVIEGSSGDINIKAAPHLELIADRVSQFNGGYNRWGPVHLDAPQGNKGFILFRGGSGYLNFVYDNQTGLYLPEDSTSKPLM